MKYKVLRFLKQLGCIRHSRGTYWLDWAHECVDQGRDHIWSGIQFPMKRIVLFKFIRLKTMIDDLGYSSHYYRWTWRYPDVDFVVHKLTPRY